MRILNEPKVNPSPLPLSLVPQRRAVVPHFKLPPTDCLINVHPAAQPTSFSITNSHKHNPQTFLCYLRAVPLESSATHGKLCTTDRASSPEGSGGVESRLERPVQRMVGQLVVLLQLGSRTVASSLSIPNPKSHPCSNYPFPEAMMANSSTSSGSTSTSTPNNHPGTNPPPPRPEVEATQMPLPAILAAVPLPSRTASAL